jgi:hypothetical protein
MPGDPLVGRLRPVIHRRRGKGSVKLVEIAKVACGSSNCPTIFAAGDDIVVQGYVVDPVDAGMDLPPGELLVRIPRHLLHDGSARLRPPR